jgi:putative membrane protein
LSISLLALVRHSWGIDPLWTLFVPFLTAGAADALIYLSPSFHRLLIGKKRMHRRVLAKAKETFLDRGISQTKGRTGVLIFLSLFERQVVILADEGIHKHIREGEWTKAVDSIVSGIRLGKPEQGLLQAIQQCGSIFARVAPQKTGERDRNELPDALQRSEERE